MIAHSLPTSPLKSNLQFARPFSSCSPVLASYCCRIPYIYIYTSFVITQNIIWKAILLQKNKYRNPPTVTIMSEMGRCFPPTNDQNIGRLTYSAASFSPFLHISSNHPIAAESGEHPVPAIIEHLQHYSLQGLILQQVPCNTTSRKSGEGIEVHA